MCSEIFQPLKDLNPLFGPWRRDAVRVTHTQTPQVLYQHNLALLVQTTNVRLFRF